METTQQNVASSQASSTRNTNTGMIIGMVLMGILAIGGVGFGVYGMINNAGTATEVADLKVQIQDDDGTVTTLETEKIETTEDNGTVVTITDSAVAEAVNTENYIYVGEWGLKIRIPENLSTVSYKFSAVDGGSTSLGVWGVDCADGRCQYFPEFADVYKNSSSLGAISRIPKDEFNGSEYDGMASELRTCGADTGLVFSDDDYNYCYSHPQSVYATDASEQAWEVDSVELIQQMLQNEDNYSKI